ncbi:MAG: HEAT repeat domain-containing protein [Planctomycetota bacterium]
MKRFGKALPLVLILLVAAMPCFAAESGAYVNRPIKTFTFEARGPMISQLYRMGLENTPAHITAFCEVLNDQGADVKMREAAVAQLVFTNDASAVEPLMAALGDESAIVRRCAISALRRIGDPRAIPALEKMLTHVPAGANEAELPNQEYINRLAAALELSRLGSDAGRETVLGIIATSKVKPVLTMAMRCAILMEIKEAIPECLRIAKETPFFGEDTPGLFALRLIRILDDGSHAKEVSEIALEKHDSPGGFIKIETLAILAKFGDESAVPLFKRVIAEDDGWEHHYASAAIGLGRLKPEGAAAYLVEHLINLHGKNPGGPERYDYEAFPRVCEALVKLNDPSVIPALREAVFEYLVPTDYFLRRQNIFWVLASLGDREAKEGLRSDLNHKDAGVRRYAANFLGKLKDEAAGPLLVEALKKETEPYTFKVMKEALAAIGPLPAEVEALPAPVLPARRDTYGKPRFFSMHFDDCATIEAMERFADLVEELAKQDARWAFMINYAPCSRNDEEYNKVLVQRLYDRGCEIESHSLNHNPDCRGINASTDDQIREQTSGGMAWIRANILGMDKFYASSTGGGGAWRPGDPKRDRAEVRKVLDEVAAKEFDKSIQYRPLIRDREEVPSMVPDYAAPPLHTSKYIDVFPQPKVEDATKIDFGPLMSERFGGDLSYGYDHETVEEGVEALAASFDDWYYDFPTWNFHLGGHDWPNSPIPIRPPTRAHHWEELSGFLREVLVNRRDRYPMAYSMTRLDLAHIFNGGKTPEEILTQTKNLQDK